MLEILLEWNFVWFNISNSIKKLYKNEVPDHLKCINALKLIVIETYYPLSYFFLISIIYISELFEGISNDSINNSVNEL